MHSNILMYFNYRVSSNKNKVTITDVSEPFHHWKQPHNQITLIVWFFFKGGMVLTLW